ncbi:MAG: helix-turn-helix transcriptional regulator [Flavobacteriaceae bacterium]|nr:helix-turn-helix transcriptional regulator [Flavobacteriaceae bacterium]
MKNRFFSYFKEVNILGLISSLYDRNFHNGFTGCLFLNDSSTSILIEIEKHLTIKLEKNRVSDNTLSDRELDVLRLLAQGNSQKEIAEELFISIHTVVTHRKNISHKLGVKSTAALVIYAVANNIIDINDSLKSSL